MSTKKRTLEELESEYLPVYKPRALEPIEGNELAQPMLPSPIYKSDFNIAEVQP